MKIALVCDWYLPRIGGIERHLSELARQLAAANHDVTVITPTRGPTDAPSGVTVHRMPAWLFPGVGLIWTRSSFIRLGRVLRAGDFEVVHVHSSIVSPVAFGATYLAEKAGLPTVHTSHSIWGGFTRVLRWFDRGFHWSRWPVVYSGVSWRVARELQPFVAPRSVELLPNAIDLGEWRLNHQPAADAVTIACVMRLSRRKRGVALIRAFSAVRAQLSKTADVRLRIAGDGPERARLMALVRELDLANSVEFLGAVKLPDVKALLAGSHFFVLPSKLEAFGIAALEARAAGLPVVAMGESGVAEFISPGVDGLLAANDDELAAHLLRLCVDVPLRTAITAHNQATPVVCTWERVIPAHVAIYRRARATRDECARKLVTAGLAASRAGCAGS